jgi:hypothetical protein
MFVGAPDLPVETEIPAGKLLRQIYNFYGDVVAEAKAPQTGVVFGLRSRASNLEGQWCCFFGVVEKTVTDLLPGC